MPVSRVLRRAVQNFVCYSTNLRHLKQVGISTEVWIPILESLDPRN